MVNLYRAVRLGIMWGLVAILLALLEIFLRPIIGAVFVALDSVGLQLPWFGVMMAGVHFGVYSGIRGWLVSLVGGAIAGLVAALFLILISVIFAGPFNLSASLVTLAIAFVVGMFGGFGGEFIDRRRG